ncbi:hypothetical protein NUSPORA_02156 [Nucleospora cyclopteri]
MRQKREAMPRYLKKKKIGCHTDNPVSLREANQCLRIKQLFEAKIKELNKQDIKNTFIHKLSRSMKGFIKNTHTTDLERD